MSNRIHRRLLVAAAAALPVALAAVVSAQADEADWPASYSSGSALLRLLFCLGHSRNGALRPRFCLREAIARIERIGCLPSMRRQVMPGSSDACSISKRPCWAPAHDAERCHRREGDLSAAGELVDWDRVDPASLLPPPSLYYAPAPTR